MTVGGHLEVEEKDQDEEDINIIMQLLVSNPCIRCGKERIAVRVYNEKVGESLITHTETSCPDSKCQAVVDKKLDKERLQRERMVNVVQLRQNIRGKKKE